MVGMVELIQVVSIYCLGCPGCASSLHYLVTLAADTVVVEWWIGVDMIEWRGRVEVRRRYTL